ncbi:glutamate-rich WD repeat-containing protein 1 [Chelonus insularis]|uniref:glutamate-rich WD repeat-containing protein 1 n=1 Tax=Chelonus insularis TaxID=460826 RepID=UPI00158A232A|nr:glutamate-rich WD repeat-containing protein 1 [Chelonus insularis]
MDKEKMEQSSDENSDEPMDEEMNDSDNNSEKDTIDDDTDVCSQKSTQDNEILTFDSSAYRMFHRAQTGAPCLSFDVIIDDLGLCRETYPLSMYLVSGTQAAKAHLNNLIIMKMTNLTEIEKEGSSDEESSESESEDDNTKDPKMNVISIQHHGCVNRIRCTKVNNVPLVASWSELGRVNIWNIDNQMKSLEDSNVSMPHNRKNKYRSENSKPLFTFKGHLTEGYGLDWCTVESGVLASGDCNGNIHLWRYNEGSWHVDQKAYNSHAPHSVEDLQWSPNEKNVLASCSADKCIKIWDMRVNPQSACMLTAENTHESDVNVISWNKKESCFIVSGGDDGAIKIWDLRQFGSGTSNAIATFKQHTAPVTTVEWHPDDSTVFASGGADDQIIQWDLSIEVDDSETIDQEFKKLPPQLLFIHQGQSDIKELHWHPQCPGTIISTAHSGFNIFRTISV